MAYKEVGGKRSYPKFKDQEPGEVLVEGHYRREIQGKFGPQFEFENHGGEIIVLNGSGQLKYKLGFCKPEDKMKITYEGEQLLVAGPMMGKMAHQFTVLRDGATDGIEDCGDQVLCDKGIEEFDNL
jgi:hypothetical protein